MRLLAVILIVLVGLIQYPLWLGKGGWYRVWSLQGQVAEQREVNEGLRARNAALAAEVQDLQSGTGALEERARGDLGMIREGEVFVQILPPDTKPPAGGASVPPRPGAKPTTPSTSARPTSASGTRRATSSNARSSSAPNSGSVTPANARAATTSNARPATAPPNAGRAPATTSNARPGAPSSNAGRAPANAPAASGTGAGTGSATSR